MEKLFLTVLVFSIYSCTNIGVSVNYLAPAQYDDIQLSKVINKDFNDTWSSIIDYSSSSFFGIDTFEKSSGLITLTFGTQNPELYADCGNFTTIGAITFDGNYMDWIAQNGGNLRGRMNITARALDEMETEIRVNAGYVISYQTQEGYYSWNFNSGGVDSEMVMTQGSRETRTCVSTGVAEKLILEAIEEIANN